MPAKLMRAHRVVGTKQTLKALKPAELNSCTLQRCRRRSDQSCQEGCARLRVDVVDVDTMAELGRACGIDVGAAVACVLKE